jgi:DNA-binding transcriptional ArsR family regulator
VEQSVDVFEAIAHPVRRDLLDQLVNGERSVSDLARPFAVSRPAISQHLRVLREAGLVTERKVGRQRLYQLQAAPLSHVSEWARKYERFWPERLDALGEYLEEQP